jgi:predicted DNA-binding ribbon-helix-helix protein
MIGHLEQRRCVELEGRKACVSLESDFWECLEQIALQCSMTLDRLVAFVGGDADEDELSARLRVFVLTYYQESAGVLLPGPKDIDIIGSSVQDRLFERKRYH